MTAMSDVDKGFTLVEILILVLILGILAMVVIPQLSDASEDARESSVKSNLYTIRSQIEVYMQEHLNTLPTMQGFVEQMTSKTHRDGTVGGNLGPYLLEFPTNPYNNDATVTCKDDNAQLGDGNSGWHYNAATGVFKANDSAEHATW